MPSPSRRRAPDEPALTAISLQSRRLAATGHTVELHGTVVHSRVSRVVAGLCVIVALVALLGLVWPKLAAAACLLALGALTADLDGGRSPVRWLWARRPHLTLLVNPPRPRAQPPAHQVLVVLPDEADRPAPTRRALLIPAGLLALAVGPLLALDAWEQAPAAVFGVAGLSLAAATALRLWPQRPEDPSSGLAAAERLCAALEQRPAADPLHVTVAVIGGLLPWFDGLEILLLNHRPRFPSASTLVLVWAPEAGPLQAVADEGLLRRGAAPGALLDAARAAGLGFCAHLPEATAARRARRLGWRALALSGARGEPQRLIDAVEGLLRHLQPGQGR
jgi:hypothetical protein